VGLFHIIGWCIIGLIAGSLAKFVMPGKEPGGVLVTILLGIAGAFVGGWIGALLGIYPAQTEATTLGAILAGTIGAVILLAAYRTVIRIRV
jgi:uncharacterized membrane protein YeaQ/YmgE (transglycosylase-associated protein family)